MTTKLVNYGKNLSIYGLPLLHGASLLERFHGTLLYSFYDTEVAMQLITIMPQLSAPLKYVPPRISTHPGHIIFEQEKLMWAPKLCLVSGIVIKFIHDKAPLPR